MPLDLDNNEPTGQPVVGLQGGEADREGAMAKADLFKLANYAHKLFQNLNDDDQLEGWVQAKITKAADYIASVYHYLEYEMKFSEYGKALDDSDVLSESQKVAIKNRLMEAKEKIKELKKSQAEKQKKEKHVHEGILSGGESQCPECGGSGIVMMPEKQVPEATKEKVKKYNRLMKAAKAAHKRMDANHNGIPDDEEMEEGQEDLKKTGDSYKTSRGGTVTKTKTGLKHEKGDYSDEQHVEPAQKKASKAGMTGAERREQKSADKEQEKSGKDWEKRFGKGSVTRHKMKVDEASKPDYIDLDKDGDKKEPMKKAAKDAKKEKKVDESKPSAGLSKEKKSEVVKKAKAGGDIGKPGKGFAKVEKAAKKSGAKDPKAVAAAAMWKNIKETQAYIAEKAKMADKDYDGDGKVESDKDEVWGSRAKAAEKAGKPFDKKTESINESTDINRIKELTNRLLG